MSSSITGRACRRRRSSRARSGSRRACTSSGCASGASTTACGRDSVSMPSCTVPMCSNSAAISHMIQCEMPFRRSAIAVAAATAPTPTCALRPQPQRGAGGAGDQHHAEHVVDDLEAGDEPHLRVHGAHELLHRAARVAGLALRVREQLDGRDVGVGVGDAAGHQRARVGLLPAPTRPSRGTKYAQRHARTARASRGTARSSHRSKPPSTAIIVDEVDDDEDQDVGTRSSRCRAPRARSASPWSRCGRRTRPGRSPCSGRASAGGSSSAAASGSCRPAPGA